MRIRYMALVLALLALTGCGCSAAGPSVEDTTPAETTYISPYPFPDVDPISDELKGSIEDALDEYIGFEVDHTWASPFSPRGCLRYYGAYGEMFVVFDESDMQMESREKIAEEVFWHCTSFSLYAYNNGNVIKLNEAYEQGLISAEDIAEIAKMHLQFDMWQFPQLYD